MRVLSVGRMVCATSAVCASWSIITGFCSFTNGMTMLLKTRVLASFQDISGEIGMEALFLFLFPSHYPLPNCSY
jgi:hypothetical protein